MAVRKPETETAQPAALEERLATIEAENTMIARAVLHMAVAMPGAPEPKIERILKDQLHMPPDVAAAVITAAQRTS